MPVCCECARRQNGDVLFCKECEDPLCLPCFSATHNSGNRRGHTRLTEEEMDVHLLKEAEERAQMAEDCALAFFRYKDWRDAKCKKAAASRPKDDFVVSSSSDDEFENGIAAAYFMPILSRKLRQKDKGNRRRNRDALENAALPPKRDAARPNANVAAVRPPPNAEHSRAQSTCDVPARLEMAAQGLQAFDALAARADRPDGRVSHGRAAGALPAQHARDHLAGPLSASIPPIPSCSAARHSNVEEADGYRGAGRTLRRVEPDRTARPWAVEPDHQTSHDRARGPRGRDATAPAGPPLAGVVDRATHNREDVAPAGGERPGGQVEGAGGGGGDGGDSDSDSESSSLDLGAVIGILRDSFASNPRSRVEALGVPVAAIADASGSTLSLASLKGDDTFSVSNNSLDVSAVKIDLTVVRNTQPPLSHSVEASPVQVEAPAKLRIPPLRVSRDEDPGRTSSPLAPQDPGRASSPLAPQDPGRASSPLASALLPPKSPHAATAAASRASSGSPQRRKHAESVSPRAPDAYRLPRRDDQDSSSQSIRRRLRSDEGVDLPMGTSSRRKPLQRSQSQMEDLDKQVQEGSSRRKRSLLPTGKSFDSLKRLSFSPMRRTASTKKTDGPRTPTNAPPSTPLPPC